MSIDILQEKIRKLKNPSLVGLDPTGQVVPRHLIEQAVAEQGETPAAVASAYETFCVTILDALAGLVPGIKVQSACFAALGAPGVEAMQKVLRHAKEKDFYVILDSARGDVGPAAEAYAQAVFGGVPVGEKTFAPFAADGVTLNGYLGGDSVRPFLPYCREAGKSVFILVKTPNRSSMEVQDLIAGGRLVHTAMADLASRWGIDLYGKNGYSQVGAVVSAVHPEVLRTLRSKYDRLFFLVSGYGAQGGTAKGVANAFDRLGRGAVVCASRSIIGAWKKADSDGRDYVAQAVAAAEKMKKDIGKYTAVM